MLSSGPIYLIDSLSIARACTFDEKKGNEITHVRLRIRNVSYVRYIGSFGTLRATAHEPKKFAKEEINDKIRDCKNGECADVHRMQFP